MFVILTLQGHQTVAIYNNISLREKMYEDYLYDNKNSLTFNNVNFSNNKLLKELEIKFKESDKSLCNFGLPMPEEVKTELQREK